ncbi:MAG: hypothetical protein V1708_03025 [Candidatus Micrarchaeota archaeon]
MAIKTAFIRPVAGFQALLSSLPPKSVAVRPQLACLGKFVDYTCSQTYKAFREGGKAAGKFEVVWLCRLSCTKRVSGAIGFCRPRGEIVALLSPGKIDAAKLGLPAKFSCSKAVFDALALEYGFGPAALGKYALEDLLVEKCAVEFI